MTSNPLQLHCLHLPTAVPARPLIRAAELQAPQDAAAVLAAAQDAAEQLQARARAALTEAEAEAETIRAQARQAAAQERATLARQARDEAVAAAVQWLCDEQTLEQHIAQRMARRWRHVTANALEQLLGKTDQSELLLHRIERQVAQLLPQGSLTLEVAPEHLPEAQRAFGTAATVTADPALASGQATLDNGLLRIHLDLPAQQRWLLAQLSGDEVAEAAHA